MKHKGLKICLSIISLILIILGAIFFYEKNKVNEATNRMYDNTASVKNQKVIKEGKPVTILLMGLDNGALNRKSGKGNTDTLEVITLNPKTSKMTMTSIPRDTLVQVDTAKGPDYVKVNSAYELGGHKQTQKQIEELLHIKINYYVTVDMGVLIKVVDRLDGVEVNNPFEFSYGGHTFPKGKQTLNGKNALTYARMRYEDPNNDYGRQKRQQQVIQAILSKVKNHAGSITLLNQLLEAVSSRVKTDVPLDNLTNLYESYNSALNHTKTTHLQGKDAMIDNVSIQIAPTSEINRLSKYINTSVDKSYSKVTNNETKMYDSQTSYDGLDDVHFILPYNASYNIPGSGNAEMKKEKQQESSIEKKQTDKYNPLNNFESSNQK